MKTKPEEELEPEICSNCNGSGEGMYEGTRCYVCHGKGVIKTNEDEEEE